MVQHDMSMMKANLLAGIAVLLLSAGGAHACDLEVKILKDNSLHVLIRCVDVEMFHRDMGNLEQYSLSAISVLAERAVAALVPR